MIVHEVWPGARHWDCAPVKPDVPKIILRDDAERRYFADSGGAPEAPLIAWATQFLDPSKVFVDVGAHVGTWALTMASRCEGVYAFEPQRSSFYRLCGGIALSELNNVEAHNVALSNYRGGARLTHVSADGGGSTLDYRSELGAARVEERVDLRQLDDYQLGDVGLLKIDVEGHELKVLQGSVLTLERSGWPPIILECWQHEWFREQREDLLRYVKSALGYRVTPITGWGEMLLLERER